jgi:hypothetical protein
VGVINIERNLKKKKLVKIKLPFKSSPQAIRADPPCLNRQRTKPAPDEKKKHLPIDKFGRSNYLLLIKK